MWCMTVTVIMLSDVTDVWQCYLVTLTLTLVLKMENGKKNKKENKNKKEKIVKVHYLELWYWLLELLVGVLLVLIFH